MASRRPFSRERLPSIDRSKRGRGSQPGTPSRAAHNVPLPPDNPRNPFSSPRTRSLNSRRSGRSNDSLLLRTEVSELTGQVKNLLSVVQRQQMDIQGLVQISTQRSQAIQSGVQRSSDGPSPSSRPEIPQSNPEQVPSQVPSGSNGGPGFPQVPQPPSSLSSSPGVQNSGGETAVIVLPDGQRIPLGPTTGQGSTGGGPSQQMDAFQKSDKWLPELPKIDNSKWRSRIDEILGYESYLDRLISWLGLASDVFASEVKAAMSEPTEIRNENLSAAQISRGVRLMNILKQAFASVPKAQVMISAYVESAQLYRINGFEIVRLLSREYGVRTRSEALHFKSQLVERTIKANTVTEVVKHLEFEWSRYQKLLQMLDPGVPRDGLQLLDSDLTMILLRSLSPDIRSYCLMHAASDNFHDLRQSALRFESTQRLWTEVGSGSKSQLNAFNEKGKGDSKGKDKGKSKGKGKGGKDSSKGAKSKGPNKDSNQEKPKGDCFRCGKPGHFARDCRVKLDDSKGKRSGDSKKDKEKPQQKGSKGKGKGGKKGKLNEMQQESSEQPEVEQDDPEPLQALLACSSFDPPFARSPFCQEFPDSAFRLDSCLEESSFSDIGQFDSQDFGKRCDFDAFS